MSAINRFPGGGSGLNFKIVGGVTQPTGAENLIWIETETPINQWCFSIDQPETINGKALAVGDVWVDLASSNYEVNALKKNEIALPLNQARQWDGVLWQNIKGYIFLSNEWAEFSGTYPQNINYTMLYDYGDECISVTGGWSLQNPYHNSAITTCEKESTYVHFASEKVSSWHTGCMNTNQKIKVADFSHLFIIYYDGIGNEIPPKSYAELRNSLPANQNEYYLRYEWNEDGGVGNHSDCEKLTTTQTGYLTISGRAATLPIDYKIYAVCGVMEDDYQTLCAIAGVSAPATLAELIGNTALLENIFTNIYAVEFMVRQCTGDFMVSVIDNSIALGRLAASPYYAIVQANEHWAKFLAMVA